MGEFDEVEVHDRHTDAPMGELIELPRRQPASKPPAPREPEAPLKRRSLTERLADAARDRERDHPSSG